MVAASDTVGSRAALKCARFILPGESAVASIGITIGTILLLSMASLAWWTTRTQKQYLTSTRVEQVRAVGSLLSQAADAMLPNEELSPLRRMVSDAAMNHDLAVCRIVLPDGGVIADFEAAHITVHKLPATWTTLPGEVEPSAVQGTLATASFPIIVPGRGSAKLEVAGRIDLPFRALWDMQAGVGAIGAAALIGMLVVYRRTRSRLRGLAAIGEALHAMEAGETSAAVLSVGTSLGREATTWNKLLAEHD